MRFEDLRGWFAGHDCIVIAPGPSAQRYVDVDLSENYWTIGCNRATAAHQTTMAVCFEPFRDKDCWAAIGRSPAVMAFSHISKNPRSHPPGQQPHPRIVQVPGRNVAKWFGEKGELALSMSPFFAAGVAGYLGFQTVGLIGVDLTRQRFGKDVRRFCEPWARLDEMLQRHGSRIVNLVEDSRLDTVARATTDSIKGKVHADRAVAG